MEQTSRKYVLTDDVIYSPLKLSVKVKLHRIKAVRPFRLANGATVLKDEIGGFIESEANLDQEGGCWIGYNAMVYGNAYVCDNAEIRGTSKIFGRALVKDRACIYSGALIYGHAKVKDRAQVGVDVAVKGSEVVDGNAVLLGPIK